jgi:glycosyltransferase involved in cell wall biosynthesis
MRILFAVHRDGDVGGVVNVVANLAKAFACRHHEVFFLHPSGEIFVKQKTTRFGFQGFELRMQLPFGERHPILRIPAFLVLFPICLYQLLRLIRKNRIEVINVHYPSDVSFYSAVCRRLLGVRLITSIHGADVFKDGKPLAKYSRAFKFLLSASDCIVAPSRKFRQDFVAAFPHFDGKTTFIHNGIDVVEVNRIAPQSLELSSTALPSYILSVTAYKPQKAVDVLVRAFKLVCEAMPAIKLILVGRGYQRDSLEALAATLQVRDRIEFLGPSPWPEVINLMRGCEVFVLSSRFETFGIVLLEAMACQKPVVATTAGGMPEIIENGKDGILVAPEDARALADALLTLLRDSTLRKRIAANGRSTVTDRFLLDRTVAAYEKLFEGLVAGKAPGKIANVLPSGL